MKLTSINIMPHATPLVAAIILLSGVAHSKAAEKKAGGKSAANVYIILNSASWASVHYVRTVVNGTTYTAYGTSLNLYWRKSIAQPPQWNTTGIAPSSNALNSYTFNVSSIPRNQYPIDVFLSANTTITNNQVGPSSNIKTVPFGPSLGPITNAGANLHPAPHH